MTKLNIFDALNESGKIFGRNDPQNFWKTLEAGANQSPKGNMWSAISVALLCMIVNLSEGKQGSCSEGNQVLKMTPERPEKTDLRPKRA